MLYVEFKKLSDLAVVNLTQYRAFSSCTAAVGNGYKVLEL